MITEKIKIVNDILGYPEDKSSEHLYTCPYCNHHKKKFSVNFRYERIQMLGFVILVVEIYEESFDGLALSPNSNSGTRLVECRFSKN